MKRYFSYDGDTYETHETPDEARARCQKALDWYRDDAADGWSDDVDSIFWGELRQRVAVTKSRTRDEAVADGDEDLVASFDANGWDTYEERDLVDVPG